MDASLIVSVCSVIVAAGSAVWMHRSARLQKLDERIGKLEESQRSAAITDEKLSGRLDTSAALLTRVETKLDRLNQ